MTFNLNDLTWEAFRERVPRETDLVLVPVGTIEAHGAIPLGTDTLIATALASDLAPRLGGIVAPPVSYGVTNSLLPYPGSTTVSSDTFHRYLFEAAAGLVDAGFRRVVLVNGHGGQSGEVNRAVGRLWNEKRAFAVSVEWWGLTREITREIYGEVVSGHAGIEETAMMVAIAPHDVNADRATTIRRHPIRSGIKARPFPASIILEAEETSGEGTPVLDPDQAARFYARTVDAVESALRDVLDGWSELS